MDTDGASSSPDLPSLGQDRQDQESYVLEGLAANVKLLLKLIQEHKEGRGKEEWGRKSQRVAGMMSIIDDVRSRLEKSLPSGGRKDFRRCNTELRRSSAPCREKKVSGGNEEDYVQKLRNELSASVVARKSLERMFSSMGREKEIMEAELARKVHEMSLLEEDLSDLKAQNQRLMQKVQQQLLAEERKVEGKEEVMERNRALSQQLLKSVDGYRSLKRKLKEAQAENARLRSNMAEFSLEVAIGQQRIHGFRDKEATKVEEELHALERLFQRFENKLRMVGRPDCLKPNSDVFAGKSTVLV